MTFKFYAIPGSSAQTFIPAVYAFDGSVPTNRVAVGEPVTVAAGGDGQWYQSSLSSAADLPSGQYMLALVSGETGGQAKIGFDTPGIAMFNDNPYASGPSDPFGTPDGFRPDQQLSFYVEYTTPDTPGAASASTIGPSRPAARIAR